MTRLSGTSTRTRAGLPNQGCSYVPSGGKIYTDQGTVPTVGTLARGWVVSTCSRLLFSSWRYSSRSRREAVGTLLLAPVTWLASLRWHGMSDGSIIDSCKTPSPGSKLT